MALTFRRKNLALADKAVEVLSQEKPMTLRQLFYRAVSAGALKNLPTEYKRLGALMTRLREAGNVPRSWLVDHTRSTLKPSSWTGLASFGEAIRESYRKDLWSGLPNHVEVFVEKDAVAGTIQPVSEDFDVRLRVCRGYASVSFAGEVADLWQRVRKPIFAYYLGDFDPSGFDIERDLREKLERYSGRTRAPDGTAPDETSFAWQRLAIRPEDFADHGLISLPVKQGDSRARAFTDCHGVACAEVDALPPTELRRRVEDAIRAHIDAGRWNRLQEVEQLEKDSLEQYLEAWPG